MSPCKIALHFFAIGFGLVSTSCSTNRAVDTLGNAAVAGAADMSVGTTATPSRAPDFAVADSIRARCFGDLPAPGPNATVPHYDQFNPIIGSHCQGTNQQNIQNVKKVVFLGDSITVGTPPTDADAYYRTILTNDLTAKFGSDLEVTSCAAWGASVDDLLLPPNEQMLKCFPTSEPKTTLVIMTIGGNDANHWASQSADGVSTSTLENGIDTVVNNMRDAVSWFRADPTRFPGGVYVIFANVYEYTDGTAITNSCPAAVALGVKTPGPDYPAQFVHMNEQFMKIAVDTQTDMLLMLEQFCGHGFEKDDTSGTCYRGPNTVSYFDPVTCIHPNTAGHARLADMFMAVVNE